MCRAWGDYTPGGWAVKFVVTCMATIALKAYSGTGWIGKAIQLQTRSRYSHIAVRIPAGVQIDGTDLCLQEAEDARADMRDGLSPQDMAIAQQKLEAAEYLLDEELCRWDFKWPVIYEAEWPRVLSRPEAPSDVACNVDDYCFTADDHALARGLLFLGMQVGKRYDLSSVVRFVARKQASRASAEKWFCSELAFVFAKKCGVQLLSHCWPWEVAPRDIALSPAFGGVTWRGTVPHP